MGQLWSSSSPRAPPRDTGPREPSRRFVRARHTWAGPDGDDAEDQWNISCEAEQNLRRLFPAGSPVDATDEDGFTPLMHACRRGQPAVVDFLLARGASVSTTSPAGATPLHLAAARGLRPVCERLLRHGAVTTAGRGARGVTPALEAYEAGHEELAAVLRTAEDAFVREVVVLVLLMAKRRETALGRLSRHQVGCVLDFVLPAPFSFNFVAGLRRGGEPRPLFVDERTRHVLDEEQRAEWDHKLCRGGVSTARGVDEDLRRRVAEWHAGKGPVRTVRAWEGEGEGEDHICH